LAVDRKRGGAEEASSTSWLQRQQEKLRERRDSQRRSERRPHEVRLISELRTAQQVKGQQQRPGTHFISPVSLLAGNCGAGWRFQ